MRVKIYRSIKLFTCILTRYLYIYFVFFISDNHFKYEFILSQRFIFLDDDDNEGAVTEISVKRRLEIKSYNMKTEKMIVLSLHMDHLYTW